MAWSFSDPKIGMQAIAVTSTDQNHPIGLRAKAYDPTYGEGEFIYLKGVASTAVGDTVIFDVYANTTTRTVAGSRGAVAVAMSANVASQYGWYQIQGMAVVNVLASYANNALAYVTATAGSIDDAVVSGDKIDSMTSKTAIGTPSAGKAVMQLSYPHLTGNG